MVRNLLAERFHLVMHQESRELPVYALVVGKNGHKLKEVEFGPGNTSGQPGKFSAHRVAIANLTSFLSRQLERPVLDMTELKGFYDFEFEWTPEENSTGPMVVALQQQLGLKLENRKAPVDVMVVDRAEKNPTEN
jgi:uncharacterized protein (TIGR03435 family)